MTRPPERQDEPAATIVIPQHGEAELTIACVRSLRRWESENWPIVIVDDGSGPADRERIERELPETLLQQQSHLGVTAAWNAGWRWVSTPYVIFLNNDVVARAGWVASLLQPLINGDVLACGTTWRTERGLPADVLARLPSTRFVEGWCFAASVAVLERLGGFDESLRLYFSDTDLQSRLMRVYGVDALGIVTASGKARAIVHAQAAVPPVIRPTLQTCSIRIRESHCATC
jgi:GT2 family glycosyltransferase